MVMQGHLETLIGVLVVHVMNNVHGIDIDSGKPIHHAFKPADNVIKIEVFSLHSAACGSDLFATDFVPAAVDRIEETLGNVGAGAEELHLFSHCHWRYTTGDGSVIAPGAAHDFITFELDGTGIDRYLGSEVAEGIREAWGIPDRQIGFRSRAQIVESLEKPKTRLGHQRSSVVSHPCNRFCDPGRIPCEEVVILGCAKKSNDAQLNDEVIDNFLRLYL